VLPPLACGFTLESVPVKIWRSTLKRRQRILSGVLEWEQRYPHTDGYLAIHLADFYDATEPKCIRAVKQLINQNVLLSENQNLMIGVRTNPDKATDIAKELQERDWFKDPKFLIPSPDDFQNDIPRGGGAADCRGV
jgi:hypothetical protein